MSVVDMKQGQFDFQDQTRLNHRVLYNFILQFCLWKYDSSKGLFNIQVDRILDFFDLPINHPQWTNKQIEIVSVDI